MITLIDMSWYNFLSYGENNYINFTDNRLTQLVGKNGHGKSSIPHILEELLFNKNSKGYKKADLLNRYVKSREYGGTVTWAVNNDKYEVTVKRTPTSQKVNLLKNSEDISQHTATGTYKLIEEMFSNVDLKIISQLIYQNNYSSLQFLTATDTNRKKFLIDLLNLEKYVQFHEKTKVVLKQLVESIKKLEGERNSYESWISNNSSIYVVLDEMEEPVYPTELENKYNLLCAKISNIKEITNNITKNNKYKEILNAIPLESLTANTRVIDILPLTTEKNKLESERDRLLKEIAHIEKLKNTCPTCTQEVHKDFKKEYINWRKNMQLPGILERLDFINSEIISAKSNNELANKYRIDIETFEKYSTLIDNTIDSEIPDIQELLIHKKELEEALKKAKDKIVEIKQYNSKVIAENARNELISKQYVEFERKLEKVNVELAEKDLLYKSLDILKTTFSTNGLLAYKIENSVKDLESTTNTYLEELSDGRFQLFFAINNDKLNIIINDNGIAIDIIALSAGELARVTTATLLAIRKLMSTLSKSQINLLILDEVIDTLDEEGKERLVDILTKENKLNTIVVSHGYRHPLLNKLEVVKTNNISKLIHD